MLDLQRVRQRTEGPSSVGSLGSLSFNHFDVALGSIGSTLGPGDVWGEGRAALAEDDDERGKYADQAACEDGGALSPASPVTPGSPLEGSVGMVRSVFGPDEEAETARRGFRPDAHTRCSQTS